MLYLCKGDLKMFISKEEIKSELKEEECFNLLTPKERTMFLAYCTNGLNLVDAYKFAYEDPTGQTTLKNPGKKSGTVASKEAWRDCFDIYGEMLRELATMVTNVQLYHMYAAMATYNIFDYVDEYGAFKFDDMDQAKEILGIKAYAIRKVTTQMHPKDPDVTMTTVEFVDRQKAMEQLAKYTKFLGTDEAGGAGIGHISIQTGNAEFRPEDDAMLRKKYGLEVVK
jgi:hypothetical protein